MHPGQVASHMQSSTTSLDGEIWPPNRRLHTTDELRALSEQPPGTVGFINPNKSASSLEHVIDTSDDEMESVGRYGSVNNGIINPLLNSGSSSLEDSAEERGLNVEKMRKRLRFYFMNPLEKWHANRQFPFKLSVQVIKIFFVSVQLILFSSYRYANVNYAYDNKVSFSHLFIKDWDSNREIMSYPPTTGPLAVYSKGKFYEYLDHATHTYYNIQNISIGPYFYKNEDGTPPPLEFCTLNYKEGIIFGFNESFIFDSATVKKCLQITNVSSFSSYDYFKENGSSISFNSLVQADLSFSLKTVRFRDLGPFKSPDCFRFDLTISFNNRDHDGQMLISLDSIPERFYCKGNAEFKSANRLERIGRSSVNAIVILVSTISLVLCCRAMYRAQLLKAEVLVFFQKTYGLDLTVKDRLEFLNFWFLLIIFNDILIIIGSSLKEQIENKELTGEAWNICSLFLGLGNLLVWFGVLRYLGFFRTYNVLILTLKRATPNVIRFLLCAILIYAGFTFCGWIVLGPFHMKFSTLSSTSECLFALINGDDMFATFAGMTVKSNLLWWFSRFYLYTFISLFIYVVLSLFIALIMDAYETIKLYYTDGFPRTALQEFISGCDVLSSSGISQSHGNPSGRISTHCHHHTLEDGVVGNRRVSAAGFLDTIVETICGCSTPSKKESITRQTSIESQPLLIA